MEITRRRFLKTGAIAAGSFAMFALAGCGSNGTNPASNAAESSASGESSGMSSSESNAAYESSSAAANAQAGTTAVVYFSCTGNTKAVAEKIAAATDGALMEIVPAEAYTSADLDYNTDGTRANNEQHTNGMRPELVSPIPSVEGFDTVYVGYPIWWGTAPRAVLTFLEQADLAGKMVIPFCTSGSSSISGSISEVESCAPAANWKEGRRFSSSASQSDIDSWVAAEKA